MLIFFHIFLEMKNPNKLSNQVVIAQVWKSSTFFTGIEHFLLAQKTLVFGIAAGKTLSVNHSLISTRCFRFSCHQTSFWRRSIQMALATSSSFKVKLAGIIHGTSWVAVWSLRSLNLPSLLTDGQKRMQKPDLLLGVWFYTSSSFIPDMLWETLRLPQGWLSPDLGPCVSCRFTNSCRKISEGDWSILQLLSWKENSTAI